MHLTSLSVTYGHSESLKKISFSSSVLASCLFLIQDEVILKVTMEESCVLFFLPGSLQYGRDIQTHGTLCIHTCTFCIVI